MKTILFCIFITVHFLGAEEVSIPVDGKNLIGELSSSGGNPSRVAFIISGSGPTDMDGNTIGAPGQNNCLLKLSKYLNEKGISTLRVDKRGVGASMAAASSEVDLRFSTYVEDVVSWTDFLEERGYSKIFLIGHSEGALVATLAAENKTVKGLICIAGAGKRAGNVLLEQLKPKLHANLYKSAEETVSSLVGGDLVKDTPPELNALFRPSVQPYLISWFSIDPAEAISKVEAPAMIVQGTTDLQVSLEDARMLHAKAKGSKLLIVEGMNHILKKIDGDLNEQLPSYFDSHLPLHSELGPAIASFIEAIE